MKIHEFSPYQKDLFREECNFDDRERQIFELKVQRYLDFQIANELHISESTVAADLRKIRSKIFDVLVAHVTPVNANQINGGCGRCIVAHTMAEWTRIPDYLSSPGVFYIFLDYRTDDKYGDIPRIKVGDGVRPVSELPFVTMSITDDDMTYWDSKPDVSHNEFGKVVEITNSSNKFTFPTDGYVMLEFEDECEFATVNIYGASEQSFFTFEKQPRIDIHSKEVFVKCGMKCEFVSKSSGAKIKFVPLV